MEHSWEVILTWFDFLENIILYFLYFFFVSCWKVRFPQPPTVTAISEENDNFDDVDDVDVDDDSPIKKKVFFPLLTGDSQIAYLSSRVHNSSYYYYYHYYYYYQRRYLFRSFIVWFSVRISSLITKQKE